MIQVIPSIIIFKGKVVKMRQGDYTNITVIDENPLELAKRFVDHGIRIIHLVDVDGAESGSPKNYHVMETLAGHLDVKIDYTGGIGCDGDIAKAFEYGAAYVTASSISVQNPELFASWIMSYGREKITMGADITDSKSKTIAYRGWKKYANISFDDHIKYFQSRGLKYVKCTDISRDGVMEGPNFDLFKEINDSFPDLQVLVTGGVRDIDDIKRLNDMGVFAVIFGRAYYEGKLSLKDLEQFLVSPAGP